MSLTNTDHTVIDKVLLQHLGRYDTPTICNALDIAAPERPGDQGFTRQTLVPLYPSMPPIVGYARTAKITAMKPVSSEQKKQMALQYYSYVAQGPGPGIIVIEDTDSPPGLGAHWGEVHTNLHKKLGIQGVITNGSMRDLDDCAEGFQILAGSVGPSHAYVHVTEYASPVTIFGMEVAHGNLIHADKHGAVVIPTEVAAHLPEAIETIIRREKVILDAVNDPEFTLDKLEKAINQSTETH